MILINDKKLSSKKLRNDTKLCQQEIKWVISSNLIHYLLFLYRYKEIKIKPRVKELHTQLHSELSTLNTRMKTMVQTPKITSTILDSIGSR